MCKSLLLLTTLDQDQADEMNAKALSSRFARTLSSICRGEYDQLLNNGNLDLDLFNYLRIISGKTAALFYISSFAGAIIGNEDEKTARAIGRFGQCLGMIFQIIDDCKDYEFDEKQAQKSVGGDITQGVITLPLILAMQKDTSLRNAAKDILNTSAKADIPRFLDSVRKAGGPDAARAVAARYEKMAQRALQNVNPAKKQNLSTLLQKAMGAAARF